MLMKDDNKRRLHREVSGSLILNVVNQRIMISPSEQFLSVYQKKGNNIFASKIVVGVEKLLQDYMG